MVDVPDISIVVPVYGSDGTLRPLYERVVAAVNRIPASFELIFIDDGGPGNPWEIINKMAENDSRVKGIKLSRNFGQHSAIMAGIDVTRGSWLVIMDCDLQDRPEEIPRLWAKAQEGHDIVVGRRVARQDEFLKRFFSKTFHWVLRNMTHQRSDAAQSNFGIYSRKVVDAVKTLSEKSHVFPLLVRRTGLEVMPIDVEHGKRAEGKSSYTFRQKLSLAMDIFVSCYQKPLNFCSRFKFLNAFIAVTCFLFCSFLSNDTANDWKMMIFQLFLLLGIFFAGMSAAGFCMDKVYHEEKGRPVYVVTKRTTVI